MRPVILSLLIALLFTSCSKTNIAPKKSTDISKDTAKMPDTTGDGNQTLPTGVFTTFGNNTNSWIIAMQSNSQSLPNESLYNNKIATDSQGNVYVLYNFYGVLDINPTSSILLTGSIIDQAMLVKYNSSGKLEWSKQFNSNGGQSYVIGLLTDHADNVYCCIKCYNTNLIQFGNDTYTTHNPLNAEIIKFSSSGQKIWLKEISQDTSPDEPFITSMTIDNENHIYITGTLFSTIIFYDSNTNRELINDGIHSTQMYYWAKLDENGSYVNSKMIIPIGDLNIDNVIAPSVIAVDKDENIYVAGRTEQLDQNVDFKTILGDVTREDCAFLAKYDQAGNPIWLKGYIQYNSIAVANQFYSAAADLNNDIYIWGHNGEYDGTNYADHLWKINGQGEDLWDKKIITYLKAGQRTLQVDDQNNVFVSGDYVYDPSRYLPNQNQACYFNKYNSSGSTIYTKNLSGGPLSYVGHYGAVLDKNNNIDVVGYFNGSITLGTNRDPSNPWNDFYNSLFIAHFPESR